MLRITAEFILLIIIVCFIGIATTINFPFLYEISEFKGTVISEILGSGIIGGIIGFILVRFQHSSSNAIRKKDLKDIFEIKLITELRFALERGFSGTLKERSFTHPDQFTVNLFTYYTENFSDINNYLDIYQKKDLKEKWATFYRLCKKAENVDEKINEVILQGIIMYFKENQINLSYTSATHLYLKSRILGYSEDEFHLKCPGQILPDKSILAKLDSKISIDTTHIVSESMSLKRGLTVIQQILTNTELYSA